MNLDIKILNIQKIASMLGIDQTGKTYDYPWVHTKLLILQTKVITVKFIIIEVQVSAYISEGNIFDLKDNYN